MGYLNTNFSFPPPKDYEFYYGDTGEEKADKTAAFLNKFEGLVDSGSEGETKEGKTKNTPKKKVEDGGEAFDLIMSQCRIQCAPRGMLGVLRDKLVECKALLSQPMICRDANLGPVVRKLQMYFKTMQAKQRLIIARTCLSAALSMRLLGERERYMYHIQL